MTRANWGRRRFLAGGGAALSGLAWGVGTPGITLAQTDPLAPRDVLLTWYRLVLELVRHTPTYSPPVASRAFAYLGISAHEAVAGLPRDGAVSLAGRLPGLASLPAPGGAGLDRAALLHGALSRAVPAHFGNTGPTGQRAMAAMEQRLTQRLGDRLDPETLEAGLARGRAVADQVLDWSRADGGAVVDNLGFPQSFETPTVPERWVPTSTIPIQQAPLLPRWGANRPFAMPADAICPCPPPAAYDETPGSDFHAEALAVYEAVNARDPEQVAIARFWSDDPMLSPTPPGHWIAIALAELGAGGADDRACLDCLTRLGIATADAFIACWHEKYRYDLLRPVTYINRVIDPHWQPILVTPPFPEYPSGHSTLSGAAAAVLDGHFGPGHAFLDRTHEGDGLAARAFPDFWAAAEEAAVSRVYGGIHYPMAATAGLDQGRCVAAHAIGLELWA